MLIHCLNCRISRNETKRLQNEVEWDKTFRDNPCNKIIKDRQPYLTKKHFTTVNKIVKLRIAKLILKGYWDLVDFYYLL